MFVRHLKDKIQRTAVNKMYVQLKSYLAIPILWYKDRRYIASIPSKVESLRKKKTITVLFFAQHPAYWRCDSLYRLMLENDRFNPVIIVCGEYNLGHEKMLENQKITVDYMNQKGYPYDVAYDEQRDSWFDIRKEINPDIIIYTKLYKGVVPRNYYFDAFWDKLFCFVPYAMQTSSLPELCIFRGIQLSWLKFYETPLVFADSPVVRTRSRITGSPMADVFMDHKNHLAHDPWKIKDRRVKRIIWAPHHSIGGGSLGYSNFLTVSGYFVGLSKKYKEVIQFAFKPHPLLRDTLYNCPGWGKQKTDAYYAFWAESSNCIFADGDYVDLFLTSDAMIHDCASFTVEYLFTGNPVMYLTKENHDATLNAFGKNAFDCHYMGRGNEDIEKFIASVVIRGVDPMKDKRLNFLNGNLLPPNGKTAAQNMIDEILKF